MVCEPWPTFEVSPEWEDLRVVCASFEPKSPTFINSVKIHQIKNKAINTKRIFALLDSRPGPSKGRRQAGTGSVELSGMM